MISFLHPFFLLGLGAVAVPVVVHLVRRELATRVMFPATALLVGSAEVVRRRRSFAERALLALRILAVAFAVLVFARPKLPGVPGAPAGRTLASVALVLDDSPSMGMRWRDPASTEARAPATTRMDEARAAIAQIFDGLEPGSRVRLQTTSGLVLDGPFDPAAAREALAAVAPAGAAAPLAGALADAIRWLRDEPPPERALYVVSDFQRSTWRDASRSLLGPGSPAQAIDLGAAGTDDWGILDVASTETRAYRGVPIELRATLSAARSGRRTVTLALEGEVQRTRDVALGAGETAEIAFEVVPPSAGPLVGRLSLSGTDDWDANDGRLFALDVRPPPSVIVVGDTTPEGALAATLIARALAPFAGGEHEMASVRQTVPPLPGGAELERVDCVVLAAPSALGAEEWPRLSTFVEEGGGLLAFSDEGMAAGAFWERARGVLPATSGTVRTPGTYVALADCAFAHPVLATFAEGGNGRIEAPSFARYLQIVTDAAPGASSGRRVLAYFSPATPAAPALVEGGRGRGRVLLVGASPVRGWGTFYREPSFLPFLHEAVAYLGRSERALRCHLVGERPTVELAPAERGARAALRARGGRGEVVRALAVDDERLQVPLGRLDARGAYDLVTDGAPGARTRPLVAELDGRESAHARVEPGAVLGIGAVSSLTIDEFGRRLAAARGGVEIRRALLGAAIAFFAAEMLLSWYLTRRRCTIPGQAANARGTI